MKSRPGFLFDRSSQFKVKGVRASFCIGPIEGGAGLAEIRSGGTWIEWPTVVSGVGVSLVQYSGALAKDEWVLHTPKISLGKALMSFQASIVYAGAYGTVPFETRTEYHQVKRALRSLKATRARDKVLVALEANKRKNAFEIAAVWVGMAGQTCHEDFSCGPIKSRSTPQIGVGATSIKFAGSEAIAASMVGVWGLLEASSDPKKAAKEIGLGAGFGLIGPVINELTK